MGIDALKAKFEKTLKRHDELEQEFVDAVKSLKTEEEVGFHQKRLLQKDEKSKPQLSK